MDPVLNVDYWYDQIKSTKKDIILMILLIQETMRSEI